MKAEYPKFFNQKVSFFGISREALMIYGILLGIMSILNATGSIKIISTIVFFLLIIAMKNLKRGTFRHMATSLRKEKYFLIRTKEE